MELTCHVYVAGEQKSVTFPMDLSADTPEAVAAEMCVTAIAMPAVPSAASADPALKPNQPTHSIAAPIMVRPG